MSHASNEPLAPFVIALGTAVFFAKQHHPYP